MKTKTTTANKWRNLSAMFAILATSYSASAATIVTVGAAADATIEARYPNNNKGERSYLNLDNSPRVDFLIKFVVSGVGSGTVSNAKIRLTPAGNASSGGQFRKALSNSWTESGVTYANAPSADSVLIASVGAVTQYKAVDIDVSSVIKGDGTYSFRVSSSIGGATYDYYSKEKNSTVAPKLILSVGSLTSTPTPTPTPIVGTPSPTPIPSSTSSGLSNECLSRTTGSLVKLSTSQIPYVNLSLAGGTRLDARGTDYHGEDLKTFKIDGGANSCVANLKIAGGFPLSTTWDAMHDTYAISVKAPNFLVENVRVHNYGDCIAIWTTGDNFKVKGAYCSQIRDDVISNDDGLNGTIEDSLFDGGYNFFSDKSWAAAPAGNVVTLRNNLVRMQAFDKTYRGDEYGHGWFWKQDTADRAVKLRLHGNIFMAERPSLSSASLVPSSVLSCKKADGSPDNTIVWLGSGPYPKPDELKTGCFKLTTDRAVWDRAVEDWKTAHGY